MKSWTVRRGECGECDGSGDFGERRYGGVAGLWFFSKPPNVNVVESFFFRVAGFVGVGGHRQPEIGERRLWGQEETIRRLSGVGV